MRHDGKSLRSIMLFHSQVIPSYKNIEIKAAEHSARVYFVSFDLYVLVRNVMLVYCTPAAEELSVETRNYYIKQWGL